MNSESITDFNPTLFRQHRDNRHVVNRMAGQKHQFPVDAGGDIIPLPITEMFHRQWCVLREISETIQQIDDGEKPVAGRLTIQLQPFLALSFLVIQWHRGSPVDGSQKSHVMVDDMAHMLTDYMLFFRPERLPIQLSRQHNKQLCKLVDGMGIFGNKLFTTNRPGT